MDGALKTIQKNRKQGLCRPAALKSYVGWFFEDFTSHYKIFPKAPYFVVVMCQQLYIKCPLYFLWSGIINTLDHYVFHEVLKIDSIESSDQKMKVR